MPDGSRKTNTRFGIVIAGVLTLVAVAALLVWKQSAPQNVASPELVSMFHTSLAAMDVEEYQRATQLLTQASQLEPKEPAIWANLTVARMRVRDLENAEKSLQQAETLAPDDPRIELLRAEVLTQTGEIDAAIEQLRKIHQKQPENVTVAYTLASLLQQIRSEQADAERLGLLGGILEQLPQNLRCRCEHARLAATLQRGEPLKASLEALSSMSIEIPESAAKQLQQAKEAFADNDFRKAATSLTFFENVIKPIAQYQQSLEQLGAVSSAAVGTPIRSFMTLTLPDAEAAVPDTSLTFVSEPIKKTESSADLAWVLPMQGETPNLQLSLAENILKVGDTQKLPFPGQSKGTVPSSVLAVDLNFDFLQDIVLVGDQGCHIHVQSKDGTFARQPIELPVFSQPWRSVWTLDIEADGDLDLVLSDHQSSLRWIRNDGDMTFSLFEPAPEINNVQQFKYFDLDGDGDVDFVTLDTAGNVGVCWNQRSGYYQYEKLPQTISELEIGPSLAIACGDINRDGKMELVALSRKRELHQISFVSGNQWSAERVVNWSTPLNTAGPGSLWIADLDNNGAVDLVASAGERSAIWLGGTEGMWTPLAQTPEIFVTAVVDNNSDGRLDLVGLAKSQAVIATNRGQKNYKWLALQPRANMAKGDQRINSFGIGGRIEVRAGSLLQVATIDSPRVHFGLGTHATANLGRLVWPNGSVQAEFDLKTGATLVAEQRLKGSCPWVFAFNGQEFQFVKDFIWRSPLGLRINAQDTAGVLQTLDHIKIPGTMLAASEGRYQVRISAELWETHFFDHVSLQAVDHPDAVEVFVDERFVPNETPSSRLYVTTPPQGVTNAVDELGTPVDDRLKADDGQYVDTFELGDYQGVASDHWVEFDLPAEAEATQKLLLIGTGWIYPTDSSINVAIAQRGVRPMGLVLEQRDSSGNWRLLLDHLGFPAGKNKTVVIELPEDALETSRHFRLRTNMEVYWDSLAWAHGVEDVEPKVTTLPVQLSEIRHRGYSKLKEAVARRKPDIPLYQVEAVEQRWLDLEGYYTRFGDVTDLLATVDDRYVIMNAGDEMIFEFAADPPVPEGWRRDFVLVGDGWVKDGDLNTAFSRWVGPMPSHHDSAYAGPWTQLWDDPMYKKFPDDWQRYHTRYVTPDRFRRGIWPPFHQTRGSH